jgi:hypothetical protein
MRSPGGASAELLRRIDDGHADMLLSVAFALEYEAVCRTGWPRALIKPMWFP